MSVVTVPQLVSRMLAVYVNLVLMLWESDYNKNLNLNLIWDPYIGCLPPEHTYVLQYFFLQLLTLYARRVSE